MTMPATHKIAVIDDNHDEIASLLAALSKKGVSYVYFTGKQDQLPPQPLSGLRIIFSDIDLFGAKDEKNKISSLLGILKSIIAPTNGPYIIVFWTRHSDLVDKIKIEWDKTGFPPISYLCMEKNDCKDENGEYSVPIIEQKINDFSQSFQAFSFYLEWENELMQTGESFISKFHKLIPFDGNWSHNVYCLLYHMFQTDVGNKNVGIYTVPNQFYIACRLFNKSFYNEFDHHISKISAPDSLPKEMQGENVLDDISPAINRFLWIHNIDSPSITPGEVFIANNEKLKVSIIRSAFKNINISLDAITLVKMVITQSCDIAQDKLLKDDNGISLHRLVYALILDSSISRSNAAWYYKFGPFLFNNKSVCMHFHLGTVCTDFIVKSDQNRPLFTIKQEILFDIQSSIANHINRPGVTLLE